MARWPRRGLREWQFLFQLGGFVSSKKMCWFWRETAIEERRSGLGVGWLSFWWVCSARGVLRVLTTRGESNRGWDDEAGKGLGL